LTAEVSLRMKTVGEEGLSPDTPLQSHATREAGSIFAMIS
jgi:hypothetical protein